MTLRPYQQTAVDAIERAWKDAPKQLLVAPTGSGKTIIFSAIAHRHLPDRTLILAHRDELITQAAGKLHKANGIFAQIEKAEQTATPGAAVVVASVQSMARRLHRYPPDHFQTVIIDEAHHALAGQWKAVLKHFDGAAKVLGVTATPDRGDKRNLGTYFDNVAAEISMLDLIRDGFLCKITIKTIPLALDITDCRKTAGDFNEADLGHALEPYLDQIATLLADEIAFRRTLVFLPLIVTSLKFVDLCRQKGIDARHVDGLSPDRGNILDDFAQSRFELLSNSALLLEGYDDPGIDCVIMLRPTQSRPLYAQAIGRGTRTAPGKRDLLVIDFLWQSAEHNLIHPAHLVAETPEIADHITEATNDAAAAGVQGSLDLIDLLSEAKAKREATLRAKLQDAAKRKGRTVDAMEFCLSLGSIDLADYEPTMPWENKPASEKQIAILQKSGIDPETVQNRGHASKLLDLVFTRSKLGLASFKQLRLLQNFGHPAPSTTTREQADAYLSARLPRREAA